MLSKHARVYVPVTPSRLGLDNKPVPGISDVAFAYLRVLKETKLPIRAVSVAMPFGMLGDEKSRWHSLADMFTAHYDTPFVNVVIAFGTDFGKLWCTNVLNIAITVGWPRPPNHSDIELFKAYDEVYCPTIEDCNILSNKGVHPDPKCLPIDTGMLQTFFESKLQ